MQNRQIVLISRPRGVAQADNFALRTAPVVPPAEGEVTVRNEFLSVEPAMRGWIADLNNYAGPVEIGSVMRSLAAGHVTASRHPDWAVGDRVAGWFGWQDYATVAVSAIVRRVEENDLPLSLSLGCLGINGVTALLAFEKIGQPVAGETVLVTSAAGAVGSAVGQIARLSGCRPIGIAGSPEKCAGCVAEFGYERAFDYHDPDLERLIADAAPDGIDIFFDNTAGPVSDKVMRQLAIKARVIICGTAAITDWSDWPQGPRVERHLLVKRAKMQGFVIFDHMADYAGAVARLADWVRSGQLTYQEHVLHGIEACKDAIARLYRGENHGKLLIRL